MKIVALMAVAAGIATSGSAQTAPVAPNAPTPAAGKSAAPSAAGKAAATQAAPAAKGAAPAANATKAPAKKAEAPPKIEGMEIARGAKGFLGLQLVGGTFKLSFYDLKKKPVAPDVARAMLRWDPKGKVGQERLVLNRDGLALSSPRPVKPPYAFKLFITLIPEGGATGDGAEAAAPAGETIVVDFRG